MKHMRSFTVLMLFLAVVLCSIAQSQIYPRKTLKISVSGGSSFLQSDINHNLVFGYQSGVYTHGQLDFYPDSVLGLNIYLGYGKMVNTFEGTEGGNTFAHYGLGAELRLPNRSRFIPYAFFRFGRIEYVPYVAMNGKTTTAANSSTNQVGVGLALEYMAVRNIAFKIEMFFSKLGADNLDNLYLGSTNDGFSSFSFGVGYYF